MTAARKGHRRPAYYSGSLTRVAPAILSPVTLPAEKATGDKIARRYFSLTTDPAPSTTAGPMPSQIARFHERKQQAQAPPRALRDVTRSKKTGAEPVP